jgi:OOP family OmpA-OmpF porin
VPVSCDDKDTGWKLFVGYQFTPNFAIEGGYTDLGKATANGVLTGVAVNADGKARGWELAAIAAFPLYQQFSIYGKLGVFRANVDASITGTIPGFTATQSVSAHSTDLTFGAGVKYAFTPNIGARLEWQRYHDVGGDNTGKEKIDLFSLGLLYNF